MCSIGTSDSILGNASTFFLEMQEMAVGAHTYEHTTHTHTRARAHTHTRQAGRQADRQTDRKTNTKTQRQMNGIHSGDPKT